MPINSKGTFNTHPSILSWLHGPRRTMPTDLSHLGSLIHHGSGWRERRCPVASRFGDPYDVKPKVRSRLREMLQSTRPCLPSAAIVPKSRVYSITSLGPILFSKLFQICVLFFPVPLHLAGPFLRLSRALHYIFRHCLPVSSYFIPFVHLFAS